MPRPERAFYTVSTIDVPTVDYFKKLFALLLRLVEVVCFAAAGRAVSNCSFMCSYMLAIYAEEATSTDCALATKLTCTTFSVEVSPAAAPAAFP